MIQSMTGYARHSTQGEWGSAVCEIRSVNHRYLDISVRLPEQLRFIEMLARNKISKIFHRGKIECFLRFTPSDQMVGRISLNKSLLQQLIKANQQIKSMLAESVVINAVDLLKWPDVLVTEQLDYERVSVEMLTLLGETLSILLNTRKREGEELMHFITERVQNLAVHLQEVQQIMPNAAQAYRDKLLDRLKNANVEYDENRVAQELLIIMQKTDISEEIDRMKTHIEEVHRALTQASPIGKRLDFLMQELHRETNTLGAKSNDAAISRMVVEMKVLIDQMREQIQNIE